jgi:hypothetical protein
MAYDLRSMRRRLDGKRIHRLLTSDKFNQFEAQYSFTPSEPCTHIDPVGVAVLLTQNEICHRHYQEHCHKLGITKSLDEVAYSKSVNKLAGQFASK